jgi:hypothetical protein
MALTAGVLFGCSDEAAQAERSGSQDAEPENALVGSYRLTARDLPDGTRLEPPEVFGYMTYLDDIRHFHLSGPGSDGERFSVNFVASYELSDEIYTESTLLQVTHNVPPGTGVAYNPEPNSFRIPVTQQEDTLSVSFQDTESGPVLTFTTQGMTAEQPGEFVDHWVRVR